MARGRPRKPKIDVGPNPAFAELEREVGTLRGSVATLQRGNRLLSKRVQVLGALAGLAALAMLSFIGLVNVVKWYFEIRKYADATMATLLVIGITAGLSLLVWAIWGEVDN